MNSERQVRNSFIYLVPTLVGAMLPIVTLPVLTRMIPSEAWGAWALAGAFGAFASSVANFGLVVSYERTFFQYPSGKDQSALLYSIVLAVVAALLIIAAITWVFRQDISKAITGSAANSNLIFWMFCASGLTTIKAYYLTYLKNTHNAKAHSAYSVAESVLIVLLQLLFVAYLGVGVIGLAAGQLLAGALVLSVLIIAFLRRLPFAFRGSLLVESLKLSYPLAPRILLNVASTQLDKYVVGQFASLSAVGVYAIGQRIAHVVYYFMTAIQNVFSPLVYERMFARGKGEEDKVGVLLIPFAYVSVGAALLVGLFAEEAVAVLASGPYQGAAVIVSVLAMYYAAMFFGKLPQLMFAKKTYLISVLSMVGIGFTLAFVTIGAKLWGSVGAAWGTLASGLLDVLLYSIVGQRYYAIRWEYRRLGAIFALFFISIIIVMAMDALAVNYALRLLTKAALVIAFLGLGVRIKQVSRQSLGVLKNALTFRSHLKTSSRGG